MPSNLLNQDLDKHIHELYGLVRYAQQEQMGQDVEMTLGHMMMLLDVFAFYVTRAHLGKCGEEKRKPKDVLIDQANIANMLRTLYKKYCNIDTLSFYQKSTDGKTQENPDSRSESEKEIDKIAKDWNEGKYFVEDNGGENSRHSSDSDANGSSTRPNVYDDANDGSNGSSPDANKSNSGKIIYDPSFTNPD